MITTGTYNNNFNSNKRISLCVTGLYFFIICLISIYSYKKPEYNWDMLAYIGLVLKIEHKDVTEIHSITYEIVKENIPTESYKRLTDSSIAYRKRMKESASDFYQELPFYLVKPIYIASIYLFSKLGFSLPASTVLPSVFSYFFISIILLRWLSKYLSIFYGVVISLLVMLFPPILAVARMSTPDCLSALFLFYGSYFIIHKRKFVIMFILLTASIFTRLDNIIPVTAILFLLIFRNKNEFKFSVLQFSIMLLLLVLCYFWISLPARSFGWSIFYYPSFFHYLNLSRGFHASFSLRDYVKLMYSNAITGLYHSHVVMFLLMIVLMFYKKGVKWFNNLSFDLSYSLLIILIILLRFVLHPDLSDRFYIAYYLMIIILFIKTLVEDTKNHYSEKKFNE